MCDVDSSVFRDAFGCRDKIEVCADLRVCDRPNETPTDSGSFCGCSRQILGYYVSFCIS